MGKSKTRHLHTFCVIAECSAGLPSIPYLVLQIIALILDLHSYLTLAYAFPMLPYTFTTVEAFRTTHNMLNSFWRKVVPKFPFLSSSLSGLVILAHLPVQIVIKRVPTLIPWSILVLVVMSVGSPRNVSRHNRESSKLQSHNVVHGLGQ